MSKDVTIDLWYLCKMWCNLMCFSTDFFTLQNSWSVHFLYRFFLSAFVLGIVCWSNVASVDSGCFHGWAVKKSELHLASSPPSAVAAPSSRQRFAGPGAVESPCLSAWLTRLFRSIPPNKQTWKIFTYLHIQSEKIEIWFRAHLMGGMLNGPWWPRLGLPCRWTQAEKNSRIVTLPKRSWSRM